MTAWEDIQILFKFFFGVSQGLPDVVAYEPTPYRDIELKPGLSKEFLKIAVDQESKRIYERSKGTPDEYFEKEALVLTLDENCGYQDKMQMKRVHAILDFVGSGKTVLDCAGGSGFIAALLRDAGNDVTVLDASNIHLLRAKWLRGLPGVKGRVESIPFPDKSFDVVIMAEVLEHCPQMSRPFAEAERVCKDDGQIVVTIPVHPMHDAYEEHLKAIRMTPVTDDQGNNNMVVFSITNIAANYHKFIENKRGLPQECE